jgi:hypothetical protein
MFDPFAPPADLPDDLKFIFGLAADPVLIGSGFCSFPEPFEYSLKQLSSWAYPLKEKCNELAGWMTNHEAQVRAEAPEVLEALQRILGIVRPLSVRLLSLIGLQDAKAKVPSDRKLVGLVNAIRENSNKNHVQLAHSSLDGICVTPDCLTELRSALSVWAKRRAKPVGAEASETPKDPTVKTALAIIRAKKGRGLLGKEVVGLLKKKGIKITVRTFHRHIAPKLKMLGISNQPARGGYYDNRAQST